MSETGLLHHLQMMDQRFYFLKGLTFKKGLLEANIVNFLQITMLEKRSIIYLYFSISYLVGSVKNTLPCKSNESFI